MSDPAPKRRWFAFSLRTLFVAIALGALLLFGGRELLDWYFSLPLDQAIASYNARAADDGIGRKQPALTEGEVIASIKAQLPDLAASQKVRAIYAHVLRTRRLPHTAAFDGFTVSGSPGSWMINLDVWTADKSGHSLRIRESRPKGK